MPEVAIEDLSIYSDEPKKIEKDVKVRSHKIITFLRESRDWVVGLPQRPTDEKLRLTALVISPLAGAVAVRNNPNLAIKYLTPLVATTTVSLATFPSATMATMGSYVKLVGDGYDKMAQNQKRLLRELEVMKQKQLELQQEFQRIQDEIYEKAAIAEAERAAKEAEIMRIEAEKAAIEEKKQLELQRIAEAELERIEAEKELAEKLTLEAELAEKALMEQETLQEAPALGEQTSEALEVQNVAFERQEQSEAEEEVTPVEEPSSIKEVVAEETVCETPVQVESVEETAQATDATVNEIIADEASEELQCPFMQEISEEMLLENVSDQQEDVELDESLFETVEATPLEEVASEVPQIQQCPFMQEVSEETLLEDVENELKLDEALFESVEATPLHLEQQVVQDVAETASEEIVQCPFMQEISEEKLLEDVLELDESLFETLEATSCPLEEEAVQDSLAETLEVTTLEENTQSDFPVGETPDDESKKAAVEQLKMDLREVVAEFERKNFGEETKVAEVAAVSETVEENEEPMVLDESLFEQILPSSDENISTENVSNVLEQLVTPPSGQISNVDFGQSLKEDDELFPERSRD